MDKKLKATTNETENIHYLRSPLQIAVALTEKVNFQKQIKRERIVKKIKQ